MLLDNKYTLIPKIKFILTFDSGVVKTIYVKVDDVITCTYRRDGQAHSITGKVVKIACQFNSSLGAVAQSTYLQIDGSGQYAGQVIFVQPAEVIDIIIVSTTDEIKNVVCSVDNEDQRVCLVRRNPDTETFEYSMDGITWDIVAAGTLNFEELENRPKYDGVVMTRTTNIPEVKSSVWNAKVDEAPKDSKKYARKNGVWVEVEANIEFDSLKNRPRYNGVSMTKDTNIPEVKTTVWDGAVNALGGHVVESNVPSNAKFTDTVPKYNGVSVTDETDIPEVKTAAWDGAVTALGGHTVKSNVPTNAKFTDTVPKYNGVSVTDDTNIPEVKTDIWDAKQESISDLDNIRSNATAGKSASDALDGHTVGKDVPADAKFTDTKPKYNGVVVTDATNIPEVKTAVWDAKQEAISDLENIRSNASEGKIASDNLGGHTVGADVPADAKFTDTKPMYNGTVVTDTTNIPEVKTAIWDAKLNEAPSNGKRYVRKDEAWVEENLPAILQQPLTASISVGGISAGKVYPIGTMIETILRDLLHVEIHDLYVGQISNVTSRGFKDLDDETLINSASPISIDDTPIIWSPTAQVQVFYMLVKSGSEGMISGGSLVSGTVVTPFTAQDITDPASTSWKGNSRGPVTINGTVYKVFGFPLGTWTVSPPDVLTINFNK